MFCAYLIVTGAGFELFIDEGKLSEETRNELTKEGGLLFSYDTVLQRIEYYVSEEQARKVIL